MKKYLFYKLVLLFFCTTSLSALTLYSSKSDSIIDGFETIKKASNIDAFISFKESKDSVALIRADILYNYFNGVNKFENYSDYKIFARYTYDYLYLISNKKIDSVIAFKDKDIATGEYQDMVAVYLEKFAKDNHFDYSYKTNPIKGKTALEKLKKHHIDMIFLFESEEFFNKVSSPNLINSLPQKVINLLLKEKGFSLSNLKGFETLKVPYYLIVKNNISLEKQADIYNKIKDNRKFGIELRNIEEFGESVNIDEIKNFIENKNNKNTECRKNQIQNKSKLASFSSQIKFIREQLSSLRKKSMDVGSLDSEFKLLEQDYKRVSKEAKECTLIDTSLFPSAIASLKSQIVDLNREYRADKKKEEEENEKLEESISQGNMKEEDNSIDSSQDLIIQNCKQNICELHNNTDKTFFIQYDSASRNIRVSNIDKVSLESRTFVYIELIRRNSDNEAYVVFKNLKTNNLINIKINFLEGGEGR